MESEFNLNHIPVFTRRKEILISILDDYLTSSSQNLIVTFNIDFLRISEKNSKFQNICSKAALVTADGVGITLLLRLKYQIKTERITGNDLFEILLNKSGVYNLKYAFVGAQEETLSRLSTKIKKLYPNINTLFISPTYLFEQNPSENQKVVDSLIEYKPDILMAALGCPRQEFWLHENMTKIGAKVNIGIGAAFDFYAGTKKRAPKVIQRIGLEWVWRLVNEPRRLLLRYSKDFTFFIKHAFKILYEK